MSRHNKFFETHSQFKNKYQCHLNSIYHRILCILTNKQLIEMKLLTLFRQNSVQSKKTSKYAKHFKKKCAIFS